MFTKSTLALGLATLGAAYDVVEEINGYKFYHGGPKIAKTKGEYETSFCHTALSKFGVTSDDKSCISTLQSLKAEKTPEEFLSTFDSDIKSADKTWHDIVNNSTGSSHVAANADVVVVVPGINSLSFAAYYLSEYAVSNYLKINAEHYIQREEKTMVQEILEGWGGLTTHFTLATHLNRGDYEYLPEYPDSLIKVASDKILRDGTNTQFGVVDIALTDVVGPDGGIEAGETGVRIQSSVWYGNGAPADFVEVESQHVVVEIVNHALTAKSGYDSGAIVLEELAAGLCKLFPSACAQS